MRILILGDSHTRSFAFRKDIYPFFMGPGSEINFKNGTKLIRQKTAQIVNKFGLQDTDWIFFHLGEPDCRLQLGRGWMPHKLFDIKSKLDKPYLDTCVKLYQSVLSGIKFKNLGIISAVTAYDPAIAAIQYLNSELQKLNWVFIDIFSHALEGQSVKEIYRDPSYTYDPLHLNSKISDCFLYELEAKGITKAEDHPLSRGHFRPNDTRKDFKVSKFGSFITG